MTARAAYHPSTASRAISRSLASMSCACIAKQLLLLRGKMKQRACTFRANARRRGLGSWTTPVLDLKLLAWATLDR